ncbi:hypothetical protein X777_00922, partial [Ooceraea biroi]
ASSRVSISDLYSLCLDINASAPGTSLASSGAVTLATISLIQDISSLYSPRSAELERSVRPLHNPPRRPTPFSHSSTSPPRSRRHKTGTPPPRRPVVSFSMPLAPLRLASAPAANLCGFVSPMPMDDCRRSASCRRRRAARILACAPSSHPVGPCASAATILPPASPLRRCRPCRSAASQLARTPRPRGPAESGKSSWRLPAEPCAPCCSPPVRRKRYSTARASAATTVLPCFEVAPSAEQPVGRVASGSHLEPSPATPADYVSAGDPRLPAGAGPRRCSESLAGVLGWKPASCRSPSSDSSASSAQPGWTCGGPAVPAAPSTFATPPVPCCAPSRGRDSSLAPVPRTCSSNRGNVPRVPRCPR